MAESPEALFEKNILQRIDSADSVKIRYSIDYSRVYQSYDYTGADSEGSLIFQKPGQYRLENQTEIKLNTPSTRLLLMKDTHQYEHNKPEAIPEEIIDGFYPFWGLFGKGIEGKIIRAKFITDKGEKLLLITRGTSMGDDEYYYSVKDRLPVKVVERGIDGGRTFYYRQVTINPVIKEGAFSERLEGYRRLH